MADAQNPTSLSNKNVIEQIENRVREQRNRNLQLKENLPDLNISSLFERDSKVNVSDGDDESLVSQDSLSSYFDKNNQLLNAAKANSSKTTSYRTKTSLDKASSNRSTIEYGYNEKNDEINESKRIRKQFIPYQHQPALNKHKRK